MRMKHGASLSVCQSDDSRSRILSAKIVNLFEMTMLSSEKSCSSVDIPIRRSVHVAFDAEESELQAIVELGVLRMTFKAAADGHLLEVVGASQ